MISKPTNYGCFPEVREVAARHGGEKQTWEFEGKVGSEPWHSHRAREWSDRHSSAHLSMLSLKEPTMSNISSSWVSVLGAVGSDRDPKSD